MQGPSWKWKPKKTKQLRKLHYIDYLRVKCNLQSKKLLVCIRGLTQDIEELMRVTTFLPLPIAPPINEIQHEQRYPVGFCLQKKNGPEQQGSHCFAVPFGTLAQPAQAFSSGRNHMPRVLGQRRSAKRFTAWDRHRSPAMLYPLFMGDSWVTYGGFPQLGIPPNGWFTMENPIKIKMTTRGTPISGNFDISFSNWAFRISRRAPRFSWQSCRDTEKKLPQQCWPPQ